MAAHLEPDEHRDAAVRRGGGDGLGEYGEASRRFAELVARVPDPSALVPGLHWSAGQTATHVGEILGLFLALAAGEGSPIGHVEELAAVNARMIDEAPALEPQPMAALLRERADRLEEVFAAWPGDRSFPWHAGIELSRHAAIAIVTGELLVHGLDIARSARSPWAIGADEARLVLRGLMELLPHVVDPVGAAGFRRRYELRLRGLPRYVLAFDDGTLAVRPSEPGEAADCRITADPTAFLLMAYGRVPEWRPVLTGKVRASGRRPWLATRFKTLLRSP